MTTTQTHKNSHPGVRYMHALHFYPAPVFYDAIDLAQFVTPLLPSAPEKNE